MRNPNEKKDKGTNYKKKIYFTHNILSILRCLNSCSQHTLEIIFGVII